MAYFIFLKSLRSLEEFRKKIPTSKSILNLLVQISKALLYSKIQFLLQNEISFDFWPNRPSSQPTHPAFLFLLCTEVERAHHHRPVGLTPPPWSAPTTSTKGKKIAMSPLLHSHINGALSPLQSFGNRHLQHGALKLLQC
jgi:hypothetical protein